MPLGFSLRPRPVGAIAWCANERCRAVLDHQPVDGLGHVVCPDCGTGQTLSMSARERIAAMQAAQLGLPGVST